MSIAEFDLLTVSETANVLRVSKARAYDLVRQGLIPAARLGRHIRVDAGLLRQHLTSGGLGLADGWKGKPAAREAPVGGRP